MKSISLCVFFQTKAKKIFLFLFFYSSLFINGQAKILPNSQSIKINLQKLQNNPKEDTTRVRILTNLAIDYYEFENKKSSVD